jgi:hypothetical protein
MKHYITPDNKLWGFDNTQTHLIPDDAVLIPETFTTEQFQYIILVDGVPTFNQTQHDADQAKMQEAIQKKQDALSKLSAIGLTVDELKALFN